MLRITPTPTASDGVHIVLEGRLVGPWVAELQAAVNGTGVAAEAVCLDMAAVHFADREGLALLRCLLEQGVHLCGASPFVQELLNTSLPPG